MPTPREIFEAMPARFVPGKAPRALTYYFSVGDDRWTLRVDKATCSVSPGKTEGADCVVKAHPDVFVNLVLHGKAPGALDIARGRFKTNDPSLLLTLKDCFSA
jgi:hypothetical protein